MLEFRFVVGLGLLVLTGGLAHAQTPDFESFERQFEAARTAPEIEGNALQLEAPVNTLRRRLSQLELLGDWDPEAWRRKAPSLGALHFLIGDLETAPTRAEMQMFYGIVEWATSSGFDLLMDPAATNRDLGSSVGNSDLSVLIWSSHGARDGSVYDAAKARVPTDGFVDGASDRLRYYVFSNCYGEQTVQNHELKAGAGRSYWEGTTTSRDLHAYIYSDRFNQDLRRFGLAVR
jgi:hypothetical protein